mgnify:CR=1 FL=1
MPEPVTTTLSLAALASFVWGAMVAEPAGAVVHGLYEKFIERWRDGAIGHPQNQDLEEPSEKSLRAAALVLVLELAGRIDPEKNWLNRWAEKQSAGRILHGLDLDHRRKANTLQKSVTQHFSTNQKPITPIATLLLYRYLQLFH